jgi:ribosomal protein L40E
VVAEVAPQPEPEPVVAEVTPEPEPEPVVAEVAPQPEPEPVVAEAWPEPLQPELPEPEGIGGGIEIEPVRAPLRVVAWDEDIARWPAVADVQDEPLAAALEAEPTFGEVAPAPVMGIEPEPVVAEVEEPEPGIAEVAEPQPIAAESAPEPEPEPERHRIAPIHETILHFPTRPAARPVEEEPAAAAAATADTPELAARRAQLDLLGLDDQGEGVVGTGRPEALPYRSRGAAVSPTELARIAAMRGSFWEASAREVASANAHVGVQSCGECGLSLSANARFCRRCGTRQARSA